MKTLKFTVFAAVCVLLLPGCGGDDVALAIPVETQDWGIYQKVKMPDGMICYVYNPGDGRTGLSCSTEFEWVNTEGLVIDGELDDD